MPGVSAGLPKAFSNGFGSFDRWLVLCGPKYSESPFCVGFGGGARGAFVVVSLVSSSGCLMVGSFASTYLVSTVTY